jgi:hypothetical protein
MIAHRKSQRIRVGEHVRVLFGPNPLVGEVVEDRGNLGVGGRQIVRVRIAMRDDEPPLELEIPAEEVTVVPAA